MIRIAVITSDPSARRGVLEELAMCSDAFDAFAVLPSDAANEVFRSKADVFLLDVQAIFQIDTQALTNIVCQGRPNGSFICCCSGCPIDLERISAIENAGAKMVPSSSFSKRACGVYPGRIRRPDQDQTANDSFLTAMWELVAEHECSRAITKRDSSYSYSSAVLRIETSWLDMVTGFLARVIRQRHRISRV